MKRALGLFGEVGSLVVMVSLMPAMLFVMTLVWLLGNKVEGLFDGRDDDE